MANSVFSDLHINVVNYATHIGPTAKEGPKKAQWPKEGPMAQKRPNVPKKAQRPQETPTIPVTKFATGLKIGKVNRQFPNIPYNPKNEPPQNKTPPHYLSSNSVLTLWLQLLFTLLYRSMWIHFKLTVKI